MKYLITGADDETLIVRDFPTQRIIKIINLNEEQNQKKTNPKRTPRPILSLDITDDETYFVASQPKRLFTFLMRTIDEDQVPDLKEVMLD